MRILSSLVLISAIGCGRAEKSEGSARAQSAGSGVTGSARAQSAKESAKAGKVDEAAVITTGEALAREPNGVPTTVRGRRGRANYIEHWTVTDGTVGPYIELTLSDGRDVSLHFRRAPKVACDAWLARSKPGDTLTVRGELSRGPTAIAIYECELVGDAFK